MGTGREASIDLIALNIAGNPGFPGKDGIVADGDVAGAAGLAGKDDVVTRFGAAGNACLGDEEAVFADFDVMAEMDEVVDFRPPPDFLSNPAWHYPSTCRPRFRRRRRW